MPKNKDTASVELGTGIIRGDTASVEFGAGIIRVFVKGIEISEMIKKISVESSTDFSTLRAFGASGMQVPVNSTIFITMTLNVSSGKIAVVDDKTIFYIDELPTDEFLAEMIRLKFKREGIINPEQQDEFPEIPF